MTVPYKMLWSLQEAATEGVLQKKLFLEILQYSQENTCAGVFLCILRNFQEHVSRKTSAKAASGLPKDLHNIFLAQCKVA